MTPEHSMLDIVNGSRGDIISPSQLTCESSPRIFERFKYFFYLFLGQLGSANSRSVKAIRIESSLLLAVPHVVLVCSKKEVLKIGTRRTVAFVEYVHSIWNWAAVKNPARNVCSYIAGIFRGYLAVAIRIFTPSPSPASIGDDNLPPKPFRESGRKVLTGEKRGRNMFAHSKSSILLCREPGCFCNAGSTYFNGATFYAGAQV